MGNQHLPLHTIFLARFNSNSRIYEVKYGAKRIACAFGECVKCCLEIVDWIGAIVSGIKCEVGGCIVPSPAGLTLFVGHL